MHSAFWAHNRRMATGDKVLKLSAEALHKLRSDHEQFLEAYEKPTQIYRFLRARHSLKPLFLQRNLSYMRMHRNASRLKHKRRRKLRVNDLFEHTTESKPDLSTDIKSDNRLEISISGLESGIDFSDMLAAASGSCSTTNQSSMSKSHERQLIEIEILLYSFSQPSAEALLSGNKKAFHCSCLSLGKRVIGFDETSDDDNRSKKTNLYLPLSIPESSLTWKHRLNPGGTQMIVFRASQYVPKAASSTRKCTRWRNRRKNSAQNKKRTSANKDDTTASTKATNASSLTDAATLLRNGTSLVSSNARSARGELQAQQTDVTMCESVVRSVKSNRAKRKPETRDAGVMTDLQFGIECINELTPLYQSSMQTKSPNDPIKESSSSHLQNGNSCHSKPSSPPPDRSRSTSPHLSRHDKCTSPLVSKLALQNGVVNGLSMKGYASPTVAAIRKNVRQRKRTKRKPYTRTKTTNSKITAHKIQSTPPTAHPPTQDDLTRKKLSRKIPNKLGSGKHGIRSFLISIPRTHYIEKPTTTSPQGFLPKSNDEGYKNVVRSPGYRRRTEIQLLLDGDKPRGQRVRADQVPKFVAEDVTSWSTKSSCMGSSTRKITPVDHYSCPILSPKSNASSTSPNHRKRSHSEDYFNITSPNQDQQPPQKFSRLTSPSDSVATTSSTAIDKQANLLAPTDRDSTADEDCCTDNECTADVDVCIQPNDVFCAELVIFDSRGDCLLGDGEYAVMMQKCLESGEKEAAELLTFEPLTWSSVFSGKAHRDSASNKNKNLLLKFSLNWTDGPPQHLLCSNLDTALDLKKIRESYYLSLSPSPRPLSPVPPIIEHLNSDSQDPSMLTATENGVPVTALFPAETTDSQTLMEVDTLSSLSQPPSLEKEKILFNFLYGSNSLQQTECKEDLHCPWCFIPCVKFYTLLKHMSLCHPRFQFTYSLSQQKAKVIDVHVNKLYDTSSSIERDPGEKDNLSLVKMKQRPAKSFSCTCVLVDRGVDIEEDVSEFMNDGSWRRGYNTNRMYYHLNSSLPMLEEEIKVDSEGEESNLEWQKICCQKMLDDFTDVNKGEKRLMKLWNLFVMENKLIAEKQIPAACLLFVSKYKENLLEEKIDRNFLSHLISQYDFGLIPSSTIEQCMSALYENS